MGGKSDSFLGPIVTATLAVVALAFGQPWVAAALAASAAISTVSILTTDPLSIASGKARNANQAISTVSDNGHLINTRKPQAPHPVVYGQFKIGGNIVYMGVSGQQNKTLNVIMTLSEGEIEGLVTDGQGDKIWLDDKRIQDYGTGFADHVTFSGTSTQTVCTQLQSEDANWNHPMRNTAYAYFKLTYAPNVFRNLPIFTLEIKGRKIYDPRSDTTAYSNNPILVARDYITNKRYGIGFDSNLLDDDTFKTVANWCDNNNYYFNGIIKDNDSARDIIVQILMNCRSELRWSNGKYKIFVMDYDSPVMTLTEENDIIAESWKFSVPSIQDTPNMIQVKFPDVNEDYIISELVMEQPTLVTDDEDKRPAEIVLIGTTDYDQARKIGTYYLERQAFNKTHSFLVGSRAITLEPGDMIQVTHTLPGWTNQICRVIDKRLLPNYEVALTVLEEVAAIYDDTLNVSSYTQLTTNLPDPTAAPPSVENTTTSESQYNEGDITYNRLNVQFNNPTDYLYFQHAEIWISLDNGNNYTHFTDAVGEVSIEKVAAGQTYYIKLVSVSTYGVKETFATAPVTSVTIQGSTAAPSDVTSLSMSVHGNVVNFKWPAISDVDLKYYELRYGANWEQSFFIAKVKGQNYSLAGVKPGTHTFLIKAIDRYEKYSANAISATIKVPLPAGMTQQYSTTDDFTTGTHNNTERYNHTTYGYVLRVDHALALTGDYTTPQYDRGSSSQMLHWLDFTPYFEGSGGSWDDVFGSGDIWTNKIGPNDTWLDVFGNSVNGDLDIIFIYSEDNITWYEAKMFYILGIQVDARYKKVRIEITDNTANNYILIDDPITLKEYA